MKKAGQIQDLPRLFLFPEDPHVPSRLLAVRVAHQLGLAGHLVLQPTHQRGARRQIHPAFAIKHGLNGSLGLVALSPEGRIIQPEDNRPSLNRIAFYDFQLNDPATGLCFDPDCIGHTQAMPWEMNRQLLDLFARSGTVLFVSIDPATIGQEETRAVKAAYAAAARPQPPAEPLDWLESTSPQAWRLGDEIVNYDWYGAGGVKPLPASIPIVALV